MTKKLLFLDYARVIALFLVVFAHLFPTESNIKLYIYAFHMPFFFFISGYLHKNEGLTSVINKMVKKMIIPFLIFILIGYIFCCFLKFKMAIPYFIGSCKGILFGRSIIANDVIWFLIAMFWVRIFGNTIIRKPIFWCGYLITFTLFCIFKINYLFIGSSLMAIPFYMAGWYGRKSLYAILNYRYSFLLGIICLVISVIISQANGKVSMMSVVFGNTSHQWLDMILFYINAIIGTLMLLCFANIFNKELQIVNLISRASISIVGLQFIPLTLCWYFYWYYGDRYIVAVIFSLLIMAFSVIGHIILEKKIPWAIGKSDVNIFGVINRFAIRESLN